MRPKTIFKAIKALENVYGKGMNYSEAAKSVGIDKATLREYRKTEEGAMWEKSIKDININELIARLSECESSITFFPDNGTILAKFDNTYKPDPEYLAEVEDRNLIKGITKLPGYNKAMHTVSTLFTIRRGDGEDINKDEFKEVVKSISENIDPELCKENFYDKFFPGHLLEILLSGKRYIIESVKVITKQGE